MLIILKGIYSFAKYIWYTHFMERKPEAGEGITESYSAIVTLSYYLQNALSKKCID